MDEAELRDMIPPKEENPLLKRKPLNLGSSFLQLSSPEEPVEVENMVTRPHLTLLFFTSEWCNVSRSFLPLLQSVYNEVNLEEKKLEIIYVGFDRNKKEYQHWTKAMPWLGLPFSDERVPGLKDFYDIRAIPRLVLIDSKGEMVNNDCRQDLYQMDPDSAFDKWENLRSAQDKTYYYQSEA